MSSADEDAHFVEEIQMVVEVICRYSHSFQQKGSELKNKTKFPPLHSLHIERNYIRTKIVCLVHDREDTPFKHKHYTYRLKDLYVSVRLDV